MIFWIVAAGLTALAAALLLRPLLRRPEWVAPRAAYDLAVYRDQLAEIGRELGRGELSGDQAAAARTEIERRLLAAAGGVPEGEGLGEGPGDGPGEANPAARRTASRALALGLLLFLPAAALGLYLVLGSPGAPSLPFAERPVQEKPPGPAREQEMERLAERLARRLAAEPANRDGWLLLGRTYAQLGRYDRAAEAYSQAIAHRFDSAEVQGALGEVLVAAAGGAVGLAARQAFAAALENDPADPRARYYAGLALVQDDRLRDAIDLWAQLIRQGPPDAPWRPLVEQQIQEAAATLGVAPPKLPRAETAGPTETAGPGAGVPGPDAADVEAAGEMTAAERAAFIRAMVERLATRLEAQPDDFEGWLRLARAYAVLDQPARARAALDEAAALVRDLPEGAPRRAALAQARKALPRAR